MPPRANLNAGRPPAERRTYFVKRSLTSESGLIDGTADVHSTTPSHPRIAETRLSLLFCVASALMISSRVAPALRNALSALFDRASPTGSIESCSVSCLSCENTSDPVLPPAPVTSTCIAAPETVAHANSASARMAMLLDNDERVSLWR